MRERALVKDNAVCRDGGDTTGSYSRAKRQGWRQTASGRPNPKRQRAGYNITVRGGSVDVPNDQIVVEAELLCENGHDLLRQTGLLSLVTCSQKAKIRGAIFGLRFALWGPARYQNKWHLITCTPLCNQDQK